MGSFAKIDEDGTVLAVYVVANEAMMENGVENPQLGIDLLNEIEQGEYIQTSYNARIRKNFATPDGVYRRDLDAFVPPKPELGEFTLNESSVRWEPVDE